MASINKPLNLTVPLPFAHQSKFWTTVWVLYLYSIGNSDSRVLTMKQGATNFYQRSENWTFQGQRNTSVSFEAPIRVSNHHNAKPLSLSNLSTRWGWVFFVCFCCVSLFETWGGLQNSVWSIFTIRIWPVECRRPNVWTVDSLTAHYVKKNVLSNVTQKTQSISVIGWSLKFVDFHVKTYVFQCV